MVNKTVKVRVYGRVQGVFFRYHTKLMADGLGLTGWVRNCPDGSVETLFSGSIDSVDQLIDWLHLGPDAAVVSKVDIDDSDIRGLAQKAFTIRH